MTRKAARRLDNRELAVSKSTIERLADENMLLRQMNQMLYDEMLWLLPDSKHLGVPRLKAWRYQG